MRALLINSSNRVNGNTAVALKRYKNIFKQNGYEINEIDLSRSDVKTCLGCRVCFDKGEEHCPLQDDLKAIVRQMKAADLLICGSPIYVEDINGIMKNFIDRLAYNSHRPGFAGKYGYMLCTSGGGATNHGITTLKRALYSWGFTIAGAAKYITGAKINLEEFENTYGKKIDKEFGKIERSIRKSQKRIPFFSILFFTVQQFYYRKMVDVDSVDYKFWYDNGWLEKRRYYYTEQKIPWIKVLIAKIFTRIIAGLVLN